MAYVPLAILAILHRFGMKMAFPKLGPILLLPRYLATLHDDLMLQIQIWGSGSDRCVLWMTLSRPHVNANTGIAISLQLRHAFKPLRAIKDNQKHF